MNKGENMSALAIFSYITYYDGLWLGSTSKTNLNLFHLLYFFGCTPSIFLLLYTNLKRQKKKFNGTGDNNILIFKKAGEKHKTSEAFMFD